MASRKPKASRLKPLLPAREGFGQAMNPTHGSPRSNKPHAFPHDANRHGDTVNFAMHHRSHVHARRA